MRLPPTPRPPRLSRSGLILALYAGLGLLGVGWGALRGHPNVLVYPGAEGAGTAWGVLAGVALGLATVLFWYWATRRFEWARTLRREFAEVLGPLGTGERFVLALASSLGEEAMFRGALVPQLGIWLSGAVFGLLHVGPSVRFLTWTFSSAVLGVALGAMFVWSGDLAGPICAHFLINFINLGYVTARRA